MGTRTIVTSQPDVACELCARRLLRGEQHEVFLAAGRPRTVCELCAPRAADAGWVRERDGQTTLAPVAAPRRGRGLLERLRLGSRAGEPREAPQPPADPSLPASPPVEAPEPVFAAAPTAPASALEQAAVVFNESEYPRRVAGLMRSLGAPAVCIRPAEHLDGAVHVTVAWELCWYRYEVDLTDDPPQVRPLEQGTELAQLSHEERHANSRVAADGTVFL